MIPANLDPQPLLGTSLRACTYLLRRQRFNAISQACQCEQCQQRYPSDPGEAMLSPEDTCYHRQRQKPRPGEGVRWDLSDIEPPQAGSTHVQRDLFVPIAVSHSLDSGL